MKIVVDENMPLTHALFSQFGEVVALSGRNITADDLSDADVLLVRSVTKVTETLLAKAEKLKFVGTATIGTDHIDKAFLQSRSIPFFSAPGSNKISVGEYILSVIFVLAERYAFNIEGKTLGIIGAGNTGTAVAQRAFALGMDVRFYDPFKANSDSKIPYVSFDDALASDFVSFHVPLTRDGEYPTYHLLNDSLIQTIPAETILMNASRGEVWDNQSLLRRQKSGNPLRLVMDVWENEPNILTDLIPFTELATPHIAGYSLDGKYRGTYMLYEAFCQLFDLPQSLTLPELLPLTDVSDIALKTELNEKVIKKLIHLIYDVRRDDALFRLNVCEQGGFDRLRKQYQERREWASLTVQTSGSVDLLQQLGFSISK